MHNHVKILELHFAVFLLNKLSLLRTKFSIAAESHWIPPEKRIMTQKGKIFNIFNSVDVDVIVFAVEVVVVVVVVVILL